jgi:hypothetical protein
MVQGFSGSTHADIVPRRIMETLSNRPAAAGPASATGTLGL